MITDFKKKKLVDYIDEELKATGGLMQKALIRFGHGLGDTIMFLPILDVLRKKYEKDCQIDLYVEAGQEHIFGDTMDKEGEGYDLVFSLDFPMSEGTDLTKAEKCCIDEIGIDPVALDLEVFNANVQIEDNPFVVVHFQGTALPNSVSCPEDVAGKIWQEIKECGKIPIECHFEHIFHNPANSKFDVVNRHVRDCQADIKTLVGMIQNSYAFIGIASGPFIVALATPIPRILYLEKDHPLKSYTKLDIARVDVKDYKEGSIKLWLENMRSQ